MNKYSLFDCLDWQSVGRVEEDIRLRRGHLHKVSRFSTKHYHGELLVLHKIFNFPHCVAWSTTFHTIYLCTPGLLVICKNQEIRAHQCLETKVVLLNQIWPWIWHSPRPKKDKKPDFVLEKRELTLMLTHREKNRGRTSKQMN